MKSIMQEASSVAKAIEQGWAKAGKPSEFSIKILELPQKNFFGMTTHSAKIALYFEEKVRASESKFVPKVQPKVYKNRAEIREVSKKTERPHEKQERRIETPPQRQQPVNTAANDQPHFRSGQWDEQMVSYAQTWVSSILEGIHRSDINFSIEQNNVYLRITFSRPVLESSDQEKRLFAALALLLLEAIKRQFRVGLRRHKIILTHS